MTTEESRKPKTLDLLLTFKNPMRWSFWIIHPALKETSHLNHWIQRNVFMDWGSLVDICGISQLCENDETELRFIIENNECCRGNCDLCHQLDYIMAQVVTCKLSNINDCEIPIYWPQAFLITHHTTSRYWILGKTLFIILLTILHRTKLGRK